MSAKRPKVPSELRRRVLIEAGHRCAIPACKTTPVEIAHIIPWSKTRKHEFKNLIALCPTCHTRFDDPHGSIDRKAMRQYKANLNPLLSVGLRNREGQAALLAAYQELRARFADWVPAEVQHAAAKSRRSSSLKEVADLRSQSVHKFSWAMCAVLDFQSAWKDSEASDLAGSILYHVAGWSDEVHDAPFPLPKETRQRDIAEEISEASTELHLMVCEELSM
ncbi:HNH endonuclease [Streptomyces sp. NPDC056697]|uniref:HNH endonuclease n=1 Tax=Streptomyces sp. NPDC056697 TaxID=3345915 RepID=UPI0036D1780D